MSDCIVTVITSAACFPTSSQMSPRTNSDNDAVASPSPGLLARQYTYCTLIVNQGHSASPVDTKTLLRAVKRFLVAYALVASPRAACIIQRGRLSHLAKLLTRANTRIALFPALVPLLFRLLCETGLPVAEHYTKFIQQIGSREQAAALLSSPLLLLLPHGLRLYIAVYASTTALATFLRSPPLTDSEKLSSWRGKLPPIWTLNVVGNAIMLPLWLFGSEGTLSKAYDDVVASV